MFRYAKSMLRSAEEWYTIVGAAAHSVAFDAGRASPFFAIDDRHSGLVLRPDAVVDAG
jgi:hypothetical protein